MFATSVPVPSKSAANDAIVLVMIPVTAVLKISSCVVILFVMFIE